MICHRIVWKFIDDWSGEEFGESEILIRRGHCGRRRLGSFSMNGTQIERNILHARSVRFWHTFATSRPPILFCGLGRTPHTTHGIAFPDLFR